MLLYAPRDRTTLLACHRLSHAAGEFVDAVDFGRRLRQVLSLDDPLRPEVLRTDARVLGEQLGRWKSAGACWEELLVLQSSDDEAFDSLCALHSAAELRKLAHVLARQQKSLRGTM